MGDEGEVDVEGRLRLHQEAIHTHVNARIAETNQNIEDRLTAIDAMLQQLGLGRGRGRGGRRGRFHNGGRGNNGGRGPAGGHDTDAYSDVEEEYEHSG